MKKLMLLLIVYSLAAGTAVSVFAADDTDTSSTNDIVITMQIGNPEMTVNGSVREIDPGAGSVPVIENDRTLLPVRAVIEALGGTIEWNGDTRTTTLTYGSDVIELTIDNVTAYLNGTPQTLDTAPTETPTATINPYLGDYDPDAGYDFDLNVEEELSAEENEALAEEDQNQ